MNTGTRVPRVRAVQMGLFTAGTEPQLKAVAGGRTELGRGAWIHRVPAWVDGQAALFDRLRATTVWEAQRRRMYDREVDVPRLLGSPAEPWDPVLVEVGTRLRALTGWTLDRVSLALYRDGRDSVAWHGDRLEPGLRASCVMAIVSLGAERRFLLRPRGGGRSTTLRMQGGDLLVMGGTIHDTFEHAVPKEADACPRIAVMYRPTAAPAP